MQFNKSKKVDLDSFTEYKASGFSVRRVKFKSSNRVWNYVTVPDQRAVQSDVSVDITDEQLVEIIESNFDYQVIMKIVGQQMSKRGF